MATDQVKQELRDALAHLYDPDYLPSGALCQFLGLDSEKGALAVQTAVIQAIEDIQPPANTPSSSPVKQAYDLLCNRFILRLTLDETAERMHMSFSSTWRAQRTAVHLLARTLWERNQAQIRSTEDRPRQSPTQPRTAETSEVQASDWRSQTKRELASLQASAPGAVSDVGETINSTLQLGGAFTSSPEICFKAEYVQPGLVAAIHPSILRQILIAALGRLAKHMTGEQIRIFAGLADGNVKITLIGAINNEIGLKENDLLRDILTSEDINVQANVQGDHVFVEIRLPSVGTTTVLVVDDNQDMFRFYQRAAAGTKYHIIHTAQGRGLFETVKANPPDIIVLDVILPDVDGWELLMRLREYPSTRSIPIIVCSVVREKELALSLGAALYLPKPVRRLEFIQALDKVAPRASVEA